MASTKNTIFNLNTLYFFIFVFFIILLIIEKNLVDLVYFGLITFYFIRIKKHRSSR